jgi:transcriptional antiterminator RfaH
METPSWIAAHVKSRSEFSVSSILRDRGYETFLPTYHSERRWSDRKVVHELPLVPGYVFIRVELGEVRLPMVTTPGVIRIVGFNSQAARIESHEIEQLRLLASGSLKIEPLAYLKPGDLVRIKAGPLTGTWGTVVQNRGGALLVLSIETLHRSIAVRIDPSWVEAPPPVHPLSSATPAVATRTQVQIRVLRN